MTKDKKARITRKNFNWPTEKQKQDHIEERAKEFIPEDLYRRVQVECEGKWFGEKLIFCIQKGLDTLRGERLIASDGGTDFEWES